MTEHRKTSLGWAAAALHAHIYKSEKRVGAWFVSCSTNINHLSINVH